MAGCGEGGRVLGGFGDGTQDAAAEERRGLSLALPLQTESGAGLHREQDSR